MPDAEITLDFPLDLWQPIDGLNDPTSGLRGPMLVLNGLFMHVEAWAVTDGYDGQEPDPEWDEEYAMLHGAVHADGGFQTTTINGREYIVVISPHC